MENILEKLQTENELSQDALNEIKGELSRFNRPQLTRALEHLSCLPGNAAKYGVNATGTSSSALAGKQIAFLGSSVTFGYGALGESFVDYLAKKDGVVAIKEAVSGTTLVDKDTYFPHDSYVARLQKIDRSAELDAFVLQLSTNDAKGTTGPLGEISQDGHYDVKTITGAIEDILDYVRKTWHVPVFVYTNPRYDNQLYGQMVNRLFELQAKWHFNIIDLYHDEQVPHGTASLYMADPIHPTRAGYREKWLPIFEEALDKIC
jgi:lysophospholipase L1-like esterase